MRWCGQDSQRSWYDRCRFGGRGLGNRCGRRRLLRGLIRLLIRVLRLRLGRHYLLTENFEEQGEDEGDEGEGGGIPFCCAGHVEGDVAYSFIFWEELIEIIYSLDIFIS